MDKQGRLPECGDSLRDDDLMEAKFLFRTLLEAYGLPVLAGGPEDAIDWLEQTAMELVNSISRRRRFMQLVNDARDILNQAQKESKAPQNGGREARRNPYVQARFRKLQIKMR